MRPWPAAVSGCSRSMPCLGVDDCTTTSTRGEFSGFSQRIKHVLSQPSVSDSPVKSPDVRILLWLTRLNFFDSDTLVLAQSMINVLAEFLDRAGQQGAIFFERTLQKPAHYPTSCKCLRILTFSALHSKNKIERFIKDLA